MRGLVHALVLLSQAKLPHETIVPRRIVLHGDRTVLLDPGLTLLARKGLYYYLASQQLGLD